MPPPTTFHERAHAWLVLARCSNLPTVWSNCLAGWLLGGGWFAAGDGRTLAILLAGVSALYTAGMFLNDVCDVEFDTRYRPERPIPRGIVSRRTALSWAIALLVGGCGLLAILGSLTALLAGGLAACIVLYDWLHKKTAAGVCLMAGCRWLLYPLAASAAAGWIPVTGWAAGGLLAMYVLGLSCLARVESLPNQRATLWPWVLVFLPVVSLGAAAGMHFGLARAILVLPLMCWLGRIGYGLTGSGRRGPFGRPPVPALLAGIPLLDLAAVAAGVAVLPWLGWFALLFCLALICQRYVPAS